MLQPTALNGDHSNTTNAATIDVVDPVDVNDREQP